ncbi:MAG TPA: SMC-Scp complex subunit ScpB [Acidobacteriaceae bacterium]|jgi:segregation and condensation protein B|nr:SMC-Scp complex subunit ScpB [Acidobacteriaceae bacterium]
MSLKARIEAVIYAAEEPVTLAQLASLFRDEALASSARRRMLDADPEAPAEAVIASEPGLAEAVVDELLAPEAASAPSTAEAPATPAEAQEAAKREAQAAERAVQREVRDELRILVDDLIADYNATDSGLEIREVAGGFRIGTRPEYHDAVRAFIKTLKPPLKLSLQALETLAVIAYKQPVTAPEIGEIRGVDSGGVLGSLVARKLITTAGRKQVVGRPILYKTTKEFLLRFGLKDVNELPSIEEFEKMATELAETEEEGPIAAGEEEIPFAQNEIVEIEEEEAVGNPGQPAPPMDDPEPAEPEPPIGEPPAEPEPAPTSEHDVSGHAEENAAGTR